MSEEMQLPENMQKYYNYREQMGRLKKALNAEFYLEAIFIEYAVMEDRLQAVLEISGAYNPKKHWNLNGKIKSVKALTEKAEHPVSRYFTSELLLSIGDWKDRRNPLIHELMKQHLTTEQLRNFALEGQEFVKILNSKSTSYRRYMERQIQKEKLTN